MDVKIKGMKELHGFLEKLPGKMATNIMRGAMSAGAKVIRDEAKQNVPVDSGKLRDGLKVGSRIKGDQVVAKVKTTGPHSFLAQWVEFGVAAHEIASPVGGVLMIDGDTFVREVDHPGVEPKAFIRPALESKAQEAVSASAAYIKRRLTKAGIEGAAEVDIEPEDAP